MKSVSIKDIARKVGVSTTTVSFVLNGKAKEKRISEDLKNMILETATELNYRPNQVARGLRTGQTNTLGLIIEDISNPFFANLAKVVEDEADKCGYTVMFCSTENDEKKAGSLLQMLKNRQIDGFLITPTPGLRDELLKLKNENIAVVLVDSYFPDMEISYVAVDNMKGAYDATEWLIRRGYKKIGLVTTESRQVQMQHRLMGYLQALEKNGMQPDDDLILKISYDLPHDLAIDKISVFMRQKKADAIFFTTNYLGVYGLESIKKTGLKFPDDLGMISFDDNDLFRLGSPAVSVISQPIEKIAKRAVNTLIAQLKAKGTTVQQEAILLEPTLIPRDT